VLGLLIADGKCTLDTRVADVLPELKTYYPDVTLRHFTTMTAAIAPWARDDRQLQGTVEQHAVRAKCETSVYAARSQYAYWDSAMNTLGSALTKIAGEPIERFFQTPRRRPDRPGRTGLGRLCDGGRRDCHGAPGNGDKHIFITAREIGAFGLLFLNHGRWNGQQLVPESWIAEGHARSSAGRYAVGAAGKRDRRPGRVWLQLVGNGLKRPVSVAARRAGGSVLGFRPQQ